MLKQLALAGLAESEVAELVSALGVPGAEPAFVHALHGETDGNPFFIEEVVRHLRDSDRALDADISLAEAGVPDGVREVTARRLRRLDAESRQALAVAAVIGREFDYDVLAGRRSARGGRADRARSRRASRRACCARPGASAATPSRTRSCARRSTTGSRSCAARGCTVASARRSRACAAPTSIRTCRSSPTTSRRRRRSSSPSARSTSRSPPRAAPTACSPGRRPPSTTARRCERAS